MWEPSGKCCHFFELETYLAGCCLLDGCCVGRVPWWSSSGSVFHRGGWGDTVAAKSQPRITNSRCLGPDSRVPIWCLCITSDLLWQVMI